MWLIRGTRLIKAAPQQLRRASAREECEHELTHTPDLPWTFTKLTDDLGDRQFDDVTDEVPSELEYQQGMDEEVVRPFKRLRGKQWDPERSVAMNTEEGEENHEENPSWLTDPRLTDMHEGFISGYAESFWGNSEAAVEITLETPETRRGKRYMAQHFESFIVSNLKKRSVEVNERHMSSEELAMMRQAKMEGVKKFVSAQALQSLPSHLQPDRRTAMRMRWVLTWKREETGERKAKARCVILGYQDPNYEFRQVAAPTMSRNSRQVMLAISASLKFAVEKGDVSGAFLH